jgi:sec-independent protein translocase protein TatC
MRLLNLLFARNSFGDPEEFRATLGEHLEELRQRLFRVVALLAVGLVIGWFIEPYVYAELVKLAEKAIPKGQDYKEVFRHLTDPFFLKFKLAFYIGLILTLPFSVFQLWGFVSPGLKPHEKRPVKILVPFSAVLFFGGAGFCWWCLPAAFEWFFSFLADFRGVALYQEPGSIVFFIVKMLLAFGIGFQLPVVVFFLGKIGIITPETIIRYWRQYAVGIFVVAAIITPSGDWFTMTAMALPLTLLFFISIFAVKITQKKARDPELNELD